VPSFKLLRRSEAEMLRHRTHRLYVFWMIVYGQGVEVIMTPSLSPAIARLANRSQRRCICLWRVPFN